MKSFQQFITEVYDKDLSSATRQGGEGGRIRASRKISEPEKRRMKAAGGGKMVPAKTYKDRSDIGTQRKRSEREQQPTQARGSAALSPREAQRKAAMERRAAKAGVKTKTASQLLAKKAKKTVDPNYKPAKASGYTRDERRAIHRQGRKLSRHLSKGINKPAEYYRPKGM
tara:strand:- start:1777 stop:2286 length:510 start_codon:yes stop_codon:yes gene_type:complete